MTQPVQMTPAREFHQKKFGVAPEDYSYDEQRSRHVEMVKFADEVLDQYRSSLGEGASSGVEE